jgi:hypothetical protein
MWAVPLTTWVPMNTELVRWAIGASGATSPGSFSTGNVSPVRVAWSTKRSLDSRIVESPGMRSPASSTTTSPGTTSATGTSISFESRSTVALTWTMASSFSTASAAPFSCQKPRTPLRKTIARMMLASATSLRKSARMAAKTSIRMMGLLNWLKKSSAVLLRLRSAIALGP